MGTCTLPGKDASAMLLVWHWNCGKHSAARRSLVNPPARAERLTHRQRKSHAVQQQPPVDYPPCV
eukprot:3144724-Amphidinium_carterae.1